MNLTNNKIIKKNKNLEEKKKNKNLEEKKKNKNLEEIIFFDSAIKIQTTYKNYLNKNIIIDFHRRSLEMDETFNNDSTLLGKKIDEFDKMYFYKLGKYFFDIRELYQNLIYSKKNPYTNEKLNQYKLNQIYRIYHNLIKNYDNFKYLEEDNNEVLSNQNKLSKYLTDISIKFENIINGVSNIILLKNYSEYDLFNFINDIFYYDLIKNTYNEDELFDELHSLYKDYKREKKYYLVNYYYSIMMENRFNYRYRIYNIINNIININDDFKITRCYIINENINNNNISSDDESD